jgi:hypothetical protein
LAVRFALLALTLAVAAPAFGQTPAPTPALTSKTIVGQIVSVDVATRTVVVRESVRSTPVKGQPAKREVVSMVLEAATPIHRGKTPTSVAELRPKEYVVARYAVTPAGARALSLRVAELIARTPLPSPAPAPSAGDPADSGNEN